VRLVIDQRFRCPLTAVTFEPCITSLKAGRLALLDWVAQPRT